ncbi:MAG TPA: hypothetical protein VN316_02130 [candidate division Zixibacteria bacterium]|nr:hypothetical protein [candidate division Zixibacteria bacterium]
MLQSERKKCQVVLPWNWNLSRQLSFPERQLNHEYSPEVVRGFNLSVIFKLAERLQVK